MTNERRQCPWFALLLMADGLTAAIGGRELFLRLRRVAPVSLQVALDGVLELPESWLRVAGTGEALLGAVLLAAWLRNRPETGRAAGNSGRPPAGFATSAER
jgi:uncharacterized protein YjeT (DUF2065 family)